MYTVVKSFCASTVVADTIHFLNGANTSAQVDLVDTNGDLVECNWIKVIRATQNTDLHNSWGVFLSGIGDETNIPSTEARVGLMTSNDLRRSGHVEFFLCGS